MIFSQRHHLFSNHALWMTIVGKIGIFQRCLGKWQSILLEVEIDFFLYRPEQIVTPAKGTTFYLTCFTIDLCLDVNK